MKTTRLSALLAVAASLIAADAFPAAWVEADGNPHRSEPWSLERFWPVDGRGFGSGVLLAWRTDGWQALANSQGSMPSIQVVDGSVRLTAGGPWGGERNYMKVPALVYRVRTAGAYGVRATASLKAFSGDASGELRLLRRRGDTVESLRSWTLTGDAAVAMGGIGVACSDGDALVIALLARRPNQGITATLRDLAIGMDLADAGDLSTRQARAAIRPCPLVESPTREQVLAANRAVTGGGVRFPDDAVAINVRAFGAMGDGAHDDTAAFRAAFAKSGLIYVPDGTYLITGPLEFPRRRGTASRRVLQGQSRDGTVIRLLDRCEGFHDPANPVAMLLTSRGVAQAFRNGVRDLTLDCGAGNPGAIGLEFFASNQGGIDRVRIRSGDPGGAGHTGLMLRGDNGPLLVRRLLVEGFAVGINADANQSATLVDISLVKQTRIGMIAGNKTFIRGLDSDNAVTALQCSGILTVLQDARLTGGNPAAAAVTIERNATLERVEVAGYGAAVREGGQDVRERSLVRWSRPAAINLDESAAQPPPWTRTRLLPTFEEDPSRWVSLQAFKPGSVTIERKGRFTRPDWSPALQAAIDSGASTIYFPAGSYEFFAPVRIKPTLRRLIGMESIMGNDAQGGRPRFIIEGAGEPLVIERIDSMYANLEFEHVGSRTLCLDSLFFEHIELRNGAGDLHLTDVCGTFLSSTGQTIRAHQLNMEYGKDRIANAKIAGGTFDLFGLKTEGDLPKVALSAGAHLDAAAYILANRTPNHDPMFIAEPGCSAVIRVCEQVIRNAPFDIILRVAAGEQIVREVRHGDVPLLGNAATVPLLIKPVQP